MGRWTDGIMGVICGDALGSPVQFRNRKMVEERGGVTGMQGGGVFKRPAGCWSDDGSMNLAVLTSLTSRGCVDFNDIMERFLKWDEEGAYTPTGSCFDQSIICMDAIDCYRSRRDWKRCGKDEEDTEECGGLTRIMPVTLYVMDRQEKAGMTQEEALALVRSTVGLTHKDMRAWVFGLLYYFMIDEVLHSDKKSLNGRLQKGLDRASAYCRDHGLEGELNAFARILDLKALAKIPADEMENTGYVLETMETAIWCLATTRSLEKALLKGANLGNDADVTCAVAGGLAGLYYGYKKVPEAWKEALQKRKDLEAVCHRADLYVFKK